MVLSNILGCEPCSYWVRVEQLEINDGCGGGWATIDNGGCIMLFSPSMARVYAHPVSMWTWNLGWVVIYSFNNSPIQHVQILLLVVEQELGVQPIKDPDPPSKNRIYPIFWSRLGHPSRNGYYYAGCVRCFLLRDLGGLRFCTTPCRRADVTYLRHHLLVHGGYIFLDLHDVIHVIIGLTVIKIQELSGADALRFGTNLAGWKWY
ncbi:unnamed protein product [Prunus armeniaca]|uniref:Uncharacterized protein n=1 Tax=Prunus armeniaca TaxID=36596 RepID=A0A6J5W4V4_PRUAR|nr:unnamed protein product [Prunus armeniaca]